MDELVAPYVGAWIETWLFCSFISSSCVAPYVGAWIETNEYGFDMQQVESHPTWVRGLKLIIKCHLVNLQRRTLRGCVD